MTRIDSDFQARKRMNRKKPVIGFRCPDPEYKQKVIANAQRMGISVQAYLLQAVSAYMGDSNAQRQTPIADKPPKVVLTPTLKELQSILDDFEDEVKDEWKDAP